MTMARTKQSARKSTARSTESSQSSRTLRSSTLSASAAATKVATMTTTSFTRSLQRNKRIVSTATMTTISVTRSVQQKAGVVPRKNCIVQQKASVVSSPKHRYENCLVCGTNLSIYGVGHDIGEGTCLSCVYAHYHSVAEKYKYTEYF